ncbi:ATP-grasp domain-containing protein [Alkalihalobacterium alkalinitrilicum]|uniref:ATP-grasp domain-containing protein n=1 Tax=Alkalihalobacterium alkalinitrilicum TaxID=427920 RepID=UPI0009955335|nr:hypothetical protein [Alkalihalobacterium alkalinitrilicum]
MNGWLIYPEAEAIRNEAFINWVIEEGEKLNLSIQLFLRENFQLGIIDSNLTITYKGKKIDLPNFAIVRVMDPFFSKQLELLDIPVFNSSFVSEVCNHKAKTHQIIAQLSVPTVDTIFLQRFSGERSSIPFPFPVILKEAEGRGGKQVVLISDENDFIQNVDAFVGRDVVVQRPAGTTGKDLRVFVIGDEIIAAVLRSSETDFKANFTLGGSAHLYTLSDSEKQIIYTIIDEFEFDFVGIDFLFDEEGNLLFNEIEDVVGSRTLSATSDINIVELYLHHIIRKLKKD